MSSSSWWVCFEPVADPALRLVCFPYAGGGAAVYRRLLAHLPAGVELWAARPPGRETRFREHAFDRIDLLVTDALAGMGHLLDTPVALFGHSMGAISAFEVARGLQREGRTPAHVFVSAHRPPQLGAGMNGMHLDTDDAILARLDRYGGTPPGFFHDPDLVAALLPNLRRDFAAIDTYRYAPDPLLAAPLTVFGGRDDHMVDHTTFPGWREATSGRFRVRLFDGGHFYWLPDTRELGSAIATDLRTAIDAAAAPTERGGTMR